MYGCRDGCFTGNFSKKKRRMKNLITIRNAKYTDIDQMVLLLKDLFLIEADFQFDPDCQARGLRLMIDGCGKNRCVQVAVAADEVVGMCTVQTLISTAEGAIVALIEDMVVTKMWQGKAVGSRLLKAVENWAEDRGISRLQLLADRNNKSAIDFYKEMDWQLTELVCVRKMLR